ncbi:MAG TPA: hypothetical protein VFO86_01700 [Terriglobia bacterium]|nr:hypothetical protein [Terriglobia bacterium]
MFLLQVAIIFWIVGFLLAFALRGAIYLLTALTVTVAQMVLQMGNGRHLT